MARTPYADPDAEAAYQDIASKSSQPGDTQVAGDVSFHPGMVDPDTIVKAAIGQAQNNSRNASDRTNVKPLKPKDK